MSVPGVVIAPVASAAKGNSGPFDEIVGAVDDEIEAVRQKQRANIISVSDGRRIAHGDEFTVYRFSVRRGMALRDDTYAECQLDGDTVDGIVLSARDGELLLSVKRDFGPTVRSGHLVLDNLWLLRALKERLRELAPLHATGALGAVDRLLGRAEIRSGFVAPPTPPALPGRRVLEEQQRAVGVALGSDTLYLWGPAGTGKSSTIADIVAALCPSDSILVVAHTNGAVDSALLKIAERLDGDPRLANGQVLRLGPIVSDELRARFGRLVSFDDVVARRRDELGERIAAVRTKIANVEAAQHPGATPLRILDNCALSDTAGATSATHERVATLRKHAELLRAEERSLKSRLETVAIDVMRGCRIVATTIHRAYLPRQVDRDFDTVIIDEAGAATGAMAITAAARAQRHLVCAGDFRQLGAPVHAKTLAARRWLARDVFTIAGVPTAVERGHHPTHLVTLRWQFRMSPDIAWLVNEPVYGGILLDDPTVTMRPSGPLGTRALIYVDTSRLAPRTVKRPSGTRTNALHAFIVRALVEKLAAKACLSRGPGARDPLAVVTPYRGQGELITRQLVSVSGGRVEASTAHRLQGGERDIIIADFTDSIGPELGHFMTARRLEEESAKLLAVMFTRARLHLVVVANFEYLLATAPADGLLWEFLLRIRQRGRSVDPRLLLQRG